MIVTVSCRMSCYCDRKLVTSYQAVVDCEKYDGAHPGAANGVDYG